MHKILYALNFCQYKILVYLCQQKFFFYFLKFKTKIMKTLKCSDAGFTCDGVISANTEDEVMDLAAQHALEVHGVTVTPELAEQLRPLIKEEAS
jgi:predicted small metal-binding protein